MSFLRVLTVLCVAALIASACGSSAESTVTDNDNDTPNQPATTQVTAPAAAAPAADTSVRPEITIAAGEPPANLIVEDLVIGDGDEAVLGSSVSVDYVGVGWSTKEEFDASWGRGPFSFAIGANQVIAGWDQGVEGMKVGGRRQLTIPPNLAYGEGGFPPVIAPNETLVFVVDLRAVN